MTNHPQVVVTDALGCGWIEETKQSWIDLKIDDGNTLRLIFTDEFPPTFKLRLQQVQAHATEERKKAGLPVLETAYVEKIDRMEFGMDEINQVVLIRTRFQNGATQDTALEKARIQPTIEFLESALEAFENPPSKH